MGALRGELLDYRAYNEIPAYFSPWVLSKGLNLFASEICYYLQCDTRTIGLV